MANTPNVTAIQNYAGKYERKLISTLVSGLDFMADTTGRFNLKEPLNLTKLLVADGARPYSSSVDVSPDDLKYTGRTLSVKLGKRDIEIEPAKYIDTWQSEVLSGAIDDKKIPMEKFVWQKVIESIQAELNDKTAYFGFDSSNATAYSGAATYAAGDYITYTVGTTTDYYKCLSTTVAGEDPVGTPAKWQKVNAEAIAEGWGTIIADLLTAGTITAISTGTIDNAAVYAYEQFKKMWRSLPVPYRKKGAVIYCSYNNWDYLFDDFENKIGKYTDTDQDGNFYLKGTGRRCRLIPATWMGTSGRLICTPKENMLFGTNVLSDLNKINTVEQLHTLQATVKFFLGFEIRDPEAIRVNDVA